MASSSEKANLLGKRKPEDGLGTDPVLKKHKEKEKSELLSDEKAITTLETTKGGFAVESNLISVESLDESAAPETVETEPIQEPKKTLFVSHLPAYTKISDIFCFFQNVGQVVRVRLVVNNRGIFTGDAFVEFASADQANKALREKKGHKFENWRHIVLDVASKGLFPPKYCIDHKVWYQEDEEEDYLQQQVDQEDEEDYLQQQVDQEDDEDYLDQQESLPIEEEEEETPPSAEEDSVLFISNLSPQTTKISHIIKFFKYIGGVVSVRLIVNRQGKHVGHAFVEFASAQRANLALKNKNGEYLHDHEILLMKRRLDDDTTHFADETVRDKTLFVDNLSKKTKISDIISFFKDVGEVVRVRLMVSKSTGLMGSGYVEFASAAEAEKAMEKKKEKKKKKGVYLKKRKLYLAFVKEEEEPSRYKYCIDHMVWYEDYLLQRESLVLQETPDFVEEVSLVKKTVFADFSQTKNVLVNIPNIISFFKDDVEEVAGVRLIVDRWGISAGCCCVEFGTVTEAKKVMRIKKHHGKGFFVKMPEIVPYPFRPKYNLTDLAEKLWYEDELRRQGFGLPTRSKPKKEEEEAIPCGQKVTFCGQKITFADEEY